MTFSTGLYTGEANFFGWFLYRTPRVRPRFRCGSENWNWSESFVSLGSEKKGMISLVSRRSETAKIWSEIEREISKMKGKNRSETKKNRKIAWPRKILKRKRTGYKHNIAKKSKRNEKEHKKLLNHENTEGHSKCILRAKYVYQWMTVSAYKYMLVLAYL
jgi:hypothetical protein